MRRLLDRNIATLVVVVLAGQALAAILFYQLVIHPQSMRVAEVIAEMTDAIGKSMAHMTPAERRAMVSRFNADDAVLIRPSDQPPAFGVRRATILERDFLSAISHRMNHDVPVQWRADAQSRLWVHLDLGGEAWWISMTPRKLRTPWLSTIIALGSALFAAIGGGIALQLFIDKPLRRLVRAADAYDPDRAGEALAETGPAEIAAVAHAFNRMTGRLAEQEAERAVMLAAVSHDIRTPLTRLRLSLAMAQGADSEMLESASRQVDRIEAMLRQFLDFSRGFDNESIESCEIAPLVQRCAAESGLGDALTVVVPPGIWATVRPIALERAVANLLANARRHGLPPFRLEAQAGGGFVTIAVGDSGTGFDPAISAALCRPFARGDAARGGDGAGLGLAIAARIASAHNGHLNFAFRDGLFWAALQIAARCASAGPDGLQLNTQK